MGAYDGAEVCELVGIHLLFLLSNICNKDDIGLYRDDGLAVFKNISGPQSENLKKQFQKLFNENGLKIEIKCNLKIVDYLDVTLNLNDGTYKPYRKPNDETSYIHAKSNHPPNIIKQIPISIENRLRNLSSNKQIFDEAAIHYQEALRKCGYNHKLSYTTSTQINNSNNNNERRSRKRNIIWFNPPFSNNVSTNVGKEFLSLIDKHFPVNHKFRKIFNRNNLKVSYSCMPNIKSIVNAHNRNITTEDTRNQRESCNCTTKADCPLNGNCLAVNSLYAGTLSSNIPNYGEKEYAGVSEPTFKTRYGNHKTSFNLRKYINSSELSKEVWNIKDKGGDPKITWRIIKHHAAYNPVSKRCNLCLSEKLYIAEYKGSNLLNKRDELISKCRHRNKYTLRNHDSQD